MKFILELDLEPGTTYATIARQLREASGDIERRFADVHQKPDGPERIDLHIRRCGDVIGQWRIER
jgi:hypothetical protein